MKFDCGCVWTDVAVRVAIVCFFLAVWLPNLGCDEQQKLLGVESLVERVDVELLSDFSAKNDQTF